MTTTKIAAMAFAATAIISPVQATAQDFWSAEQALRESQYRAEAERARAEEIVRQQREEEQRRQEEERRVRELEEAQRKANTG